MKRVLSGTLAAFAAAILAFSLIFITVSAANAESAAQPPEKVVADFSGELTGWQAQGGSVSDGAYSLGAGGFLKTESAFMYFIADFSVKGSFELVFGEQDGREGAFGIAVGQDNSVVLRGVTTADGASSATLSRDLKLSEGYADVRLKVIGASVVLYGRADGDPLNWYELGSFLFGGDGAAVYGKVGIYADGGAELESAAVYSLDSNIGIEADNYDPADEVAGKHKKPVRGLEQWEIALIIAACAVVVAGGGAAAVILIKKKRKKKSSGVLPSEGGTENGSSDDGEEK